MAHVEDAMLPPDKEPGSLGTYHITHECFLNGEQVFHMDLRGVNHSTFHPWEFHVSAVVHNSLGHAPHARGWYRIMEFDARNRHCIVDIGHGIGHRMNMKWMLDNLASARVYQWHAWP